MDENNAQNETEAANTDLKWCGGCREFKSRDEFYKDRTTKDGLQYTCKSCKKKYPQSDKAKETRKKYTQSSKFKESQTKYRKSKKGKETIEKSGQTLDRRYNRLLTIAKSRNMIIEMTKDQYEKLYHLPCFYCNNEIGEVVKFSTGLDRINNEEGYTFENSLPCCKICNKSRNNNLSVDGMKAAIQAIIKFRKENNGNKNM